MNRYDRRLRLLATTLAALAGFVDAIAFLELGGFFVSFMSGNSTRLGVGLAALSGQAAVAGGLIGAFVSGVVIGDLAGCKAGRRRRAAVLSLVTAMLAAAAVAGVVDGLWIAVGTAAAAMGAANAVFERDGEVSIGVTYMTGTLVKGGQRVAAALRGGDPLGWWPYLQLWLGLALGGALGALTQAHMGLAGFWIAAGVCAGCAIAAAVIDRRDR
jgi:uncharacterized membrane protein YoaK (UPF0700 family)